MITLRELEEYLDFCENQLLSEERRRAVKLYSAQVLGRLLFDYSEKLFPVAAAHPAKCTCHLCRAATCVEDALRHIREAEKLEAVHVD